MVIKMDVVYEIDNDESIKIFNFSSLKAHYY